MAVYGYCLVCGKMVAIRPGPPKMGMKQTWYPQEHDAPDGTRCVIGPKKGI